MNMSLVGANRSSSNWNLVAVKFGWTSQTNKSMLNSTWISCSINKLNPSSRSSTTGSIRSAKVSSFIPSNQRSLSSWSVATLYSTSRHFKKQPFTKMGTMRRAKWLNGFGQWFMSCLRTRRRSFYSSALGVTGLQSMDWAVWSSWSPEQGQMRLVCLLCTPASTIWCCPSIRL